MFTAVRYRIFWPLLGCLLLGSLTGSLAFAQPQVSVVTSEGANSEGAHYVGVPIEIQVVADGFEENPQPDITPPEIAQGQLQFRGVSPNISTSVQIINGRMSQSKTVRFIFRYVFSANAPGNYQIGSFQVTQNGQTLSTRTLNLNLVDIPNAENQTIELLVPEKPVYLGQRVPIKLEWWTDYELRGKLMNQRMQVPLLDQLSDFQITRKENKDANTTLVIDLATGAQEYRALARVDYRDNKQYIVYSLDFIVTPLKAGEFVLEPVLLTVDEVIRWRRNVFNDRVPTQARKRLVSDTRQRVLSVKAPPSENRPASFSGAVGRGFDLDVTTDRSVVQVGDPIQLTLTLHGDSAIDAVSLPALEKLGLKPELFRLPDNEIAGVSADDSKQFQASIRVLDESVREIPPLQFSWFDPESEQYQTTYSEPIALSVRAAKIVSAADVVSARDEEESDDPADPAAQTSPPSTSDAATEATASTSRRLPFTLSGADLSIETNLDSLSRSSLATLSQWPAQLGFYLIGLSLPLLALLMRRRAARDPAISARLKALQQQREQVAKAASVGDVAQALRQMAAEVNDFPRAEFDAVIAECDNQLYAPGGATAAIAESLRQRALGLADQMLEQAR